MFFQVVILIFQLVAGVFQVVARMLGGRYFNLKWFSRVFTRARELLCCPWWLLELGDTASARIFYLKWLLSFHPIAMTLLGGGYVIPGDS